MICSFDSKSNRWRNIETVQYTKRPTGSSELVINGRVNKADIDAWASQRGIRILGNADLDCFPSDGFKYDGEGYRIHVYGLDLSHKQIDQHLTQPMDQLQVLKILQPIKL